MIDPAQYMNGTLDSSKKTRWTRSFSKIVLGRNLSAGLARVRGHNQGTVQCYVDIHTWTYPGGGGGGMQKRME